VFGAGNVLTPQRETKSENERRLQKSKKGEEMSPPIFIAY
jgi:hypothetical protein